MEVGRNIRDVTVSPLNKMVNPKFSRDQIGNTEAIIHLKKSLGKGKNWLQSLVESISLWTLEEENHKNQHNRYLLDGEAFDWLLLAERLLHEVDGLIPDDEKTGFLFSGDFSNHLSQEDFKKLLGPTKYSGYLNYWYGVIVEEAVIRNAENEEGKGFPRSGKSASTKITELAYKKLYGFDQQELYSKFLSDKGYNRPKRFSIGLAKEFTYWLFKFRLIHSEPERVASDTRKGLLFLNKMRSNI